MSCRCVLVLVLCRVALFRGVFVCGILAGLCVSVLGYRSDVLRLGRRYDLALSTQTGDRPTALAIIAARQSAGPLEPSGLAAAVKRLGLAVALRHAQPAQNPFARPVGEPGVQLEVDAEHGETVWTELTEFTELELPSN